MRIQDTERWFQALQSIVEERIKKAQEEGLFDDLPGKGKPLKLDDDSMIAPHLRASYRILKNAGILPPEMQARKDIGDLKQLLSEVRCEEEAEKLVAEINRKILASNILGGFSVSSGMDELYAEKVLHRLRSRRSRHHLRRLVP